MADPVIPEGEALRVSFAPDINPLLAEAFLEEAPVHAGRFSDVMARLAGDDASLEDVALAQRVAHSLKGSANITGVTAIASVTHQAEDILDWLADSGQLPPPELRGTLVDTADCVAAMVDALSSGGPVPDETLHVLARLRTWREQQLAGDAACAAAAPADAPAGDAPVPPAADSGSAPAAQAPAGSVSEVMATPSAPETGVATASAGAPAAPQNSSSPTPSPAATLRVPVTLVDRLLRLAGELAISNVQAQGAQQRMTARANTLREQFHLVQQRLSDLQDVVEIRGVPARHRHARGGATTTGVSTFGATTNNGALVGDFDPLELDEYNELHSKSTALAEAVTDFCEVALGMRPELARMDDTVADQQRISKEFSDAVLSARMVSVGNVEQRLQRAVRETSRVTGKQATLTLAGGDIPVDGDVLNALVDPLLHLLRNAVDHGIEEPSQREALGKSSVGGLEVRFARDGENVLVQVRDDGAGFDLAAIRQVAESRGILGKDDFRADRELLQMTVGPGFSTRREATQVSGRGIGMDVVHKAVQDLKGSMDITSAPGSGSTISLRVPLTLISMHVLLVRAGGQLFGVPSGALQQVLFSDQGQFRGEGDDAVFALEDRDYQVRRLDRMVGRAPDPAGARRVLPLLLLEADSGPTAIVVDAAVDGRYLVVNSLGARVPRPPGVIGASILGDGGVAPVLDLREMLRHRPVVTEGVGGAAAPAKLTPETVAPEVLVVDDSLTARRMLTIAISDAGYRVRTAIDGLDAVEAIEESMPDLVVTDLEMPRMNGLELAGHLRADAATAALPILMVTSRSTEKHRGQASAAGINDFITKPYANDELLQMVAQLLDEVAVNAS